MSNYGRFKCRDIRYKRHVDKFIKNLINDYKLEEADNVIFISSPMTGIDNYEKEFDELVKNVYNTFSEQDIFVINPTKYHYIFEEYKLDNPNEEFDDYLYIMYLDFRLLDLCTIMYSNDNHEKWLESRGCLLEALYADLNGIDIWGSDYFNNALKFREYLDENMN